MPYSFGTLWNTKSYQVSNENDRDIPCCDLLNDLPAYENDYADSMQPLIQQIIFS